MPVSRKRKKVKNRIKENKVRDYSKYDGTYEVTDKGNELIKDILEYITSDIDINNTDNTFVSMLKSDIFKGVDIYNKSAVLNSGPFKVMSTMFNLSGCILNETTN